MFNYASAERKLALLCVVMNTSCCKVITIVIVARAWGVPGFENKEKKEVKRHHPLVQAVCERFASGY